MNSYTACLNNQDKFDFDYLLILYSFRVDSFIALCKKYCICKIKA